MAEPAHTSSLAGTLLARRYQLHALIKAGGMGSVYLAEDVKIGRRVAIKVLDPALVEDPGMLRRFFREAKAAGSIQHPNIVDYLDFDQIEGGPAYLVMEYLAGDDLERVLQRRGPCTWSQLAPLLLQACRALASAHRAGIIHRDIKPSNIILLEDAAPKPFVKLIDFGIARMTEDSKLYSVTDVTRQLMGTDRFMAPELYMGIAANPRTDIYAFGVMMYRLLTGKYPQAEGYDVESPSRIRPAAAVPVRADAAIVRAVQFYPYARFETMAELEAEILASLTEPVAPPPELPVLPTVTVPERSFREQFQATSSRGDSENSITVARAASPASIAAVADAVDEPSRTLERSAVPLDAPWPVIAEVPRETEVNVSAQATLKAEPVPPVVGPKTNALPQADIMSASRAGESKVASIPAPARRWRLVATLVVVVLGAIAVIISQRGSLRPEPAAASVIMPGTIAVSAPRRAENPVTNQTTAPLDEPSGPLAASTPTAEVLEEPVEPGKLSVDDASLPDPPPAAALPPKLGPKRGKHVRARPSFVTAAVKARLVRALRAGTDACLAEHRATHGYTFPVDVVVDPQGQVTAPGAKSNSELRRCLVGLLAGVSVGETTTGGSFSHVFKPGE